jgi:hypothetical protein
MSQNALPVTVTIGASFSVSFLVERMCKRESRPRPTKTVVRTSHHCGFAGNSTTTIPGLSPVGAALTPREGIFALLSRWAADVNVAAAKLKLTLENGKRLTPSLARS